MYSFAVGPRIVASLHFHRFRRQIEKYHQFTKKEDLEPIRMTGALDGNIPVNQPPWQLAQAHAIAGNQA